MTKQYVAKDMSIKYGDSKLSYFFVYIEGFYFYYDETTREEYNESKLKQIIYSNKKTVYVNPDCKKKLIEERIRREEKRAKYFLGIKIPKWLNQN